MRKTTIFTFTLLSLAILPAVAQIQTGGLGQVWTDFQSYSKDMQDYFQYNLKDTLNPLEQSQGRIAIENAKGDLKIPNPVAAGQKIRDDVINYSYNSDAKSSRFENNSAVRGNLVSNELNRIITRGVAIGVLGKNGQIRTKTKLENTEKSLEDIETLAQATETSNDAFIQQIKNGINVAGKTDPTVSAISGLAELLGVSQVQMMKIQQEQIKIVAETFAQTLQNNQALQYSNLNLANISQQSEEANRARRVETSTEAARLLRATSQLDLFGRKVNK
ncbi:hypothetical protein CDG76_19980 [Nostoc sp. 'Peltigera membranacea cyanobiont' 210A]|uniref:hypothetical protein n=1 Tax=Nostoc sp. 'Peltigera membranacea cyanobiont' 210A TaxID=2014529 RepID=UPI000B95BB30|nr:hypothetical protein [Nostoc sp. 'Peltigera membranacea cyanobiont' 210A]OYD92985.1 hypothetical protein CDG76_19980 [Nostoc sp. 'Peltigera membranacea cyanobiont' 210A]